MKPFRILVLAALVLGLGPRIDDRAPIESPGWTTHGPATGGYTDLAVHPLRPSTLYAATPLQGLLRSDDGGNSWRSINRTDASPFGGFGMAPSAGEILYAFADNEVSRTEDGGSSWISAGTVPTGGLVHRLFVDPVESRTLYASNLEIVGHGLQRASLYKSTDGGRSWAALPILGTLMQRVLIDPANPARLYAAPGQIYPIVRSLDGGQSWFPIVPPNTFGAFDVAADPSDFSRVYAVCLSSDSPPSTSIFVSRDGGETWSPLADAPSDFVVALVVDPRRSATLYASSRGGLYRSDDSGGTWRRLRSDSFASMTAFDPTDPATIYGSGGKSADGGLTWSALATGDVASYVTSLALSARSLFAAGMDQLGTVAVFRSDDGGSTWSTLHTGLPQYKNALSSIAVDPSQSGIVYAGVSGPAKNILPGVFKSENDGLVWFPAGEGLPDGGVLDLVVDPSRPQTVFAGTFDGPYRTVDGGRTWTPRNVGMTSPVSDLAIDPTDSNRLYAATGSELFRSTDEGATWSSVRFAIPEAPDSPNTPIRFLAIDPARPWVVFGLSRLGILRSADFGGTWSIVFVPPPSRSDLSAIAIDPSRPADVYVGTAFSGALVSRDGGNSWQWLSRGLPGTEIASILPDPTHGIVHAATLGRGVWELPSPPGRARRPVPRTL